MTNNSHDWVITGVNRLTGSREEISRARANKKQRAFLRLLAERLTPRQLTILIEEI